MATIGKFFDNYVSIDNTKPALLFESVREAVKMLVAAGWVVEESGNGTATGPGDLIGTAPLANQFWYRLASPEGKEFVFRRTSSSFLNIYYSRLDKFVATAGTATIPPTAADQLDTLQNSGYRSTDSADRCVGFAETVYPYRFYFGYMDNSDANNRIRGGIVYDAVEAVTNDIDPYIIWRFPSTFSPSSGYCYFENASGGTWHTTNIDLNAGITSSALSPYDGGRPSAPVLMYEPTGSADPDGVKGFSSLFIRSFSTGQPTAGPLRYTNQDSEEYIYTGFNSYYLAWKGDPPPGFSFATEISGRTYYPEGFKAGAVSIKTPPVIENLLPADGSTIEPTDAIGFDIVDAETISNVLIWAEFESLQGKYMIYDGEAFTEDFVGSSLIDVNSDGTLLRFSLLKQGGWVYNITKLRVRAFDGAGTIDLEA